MSFQIGFLLFPDVQQLDLTGPYDVLAAMPGAHVHLIAASMAPVRSSNGLWLTPTMTFDDCPPVLDVLCVPGGSGVDALLEDAVVLDFIRQRAAQARYVTSVCTGALVLGAAGLLRGVRATTHWASQSYLSAYGATSVAARVVRDGRIITGGGVTAGIDFALTVVAELHDDATAQAIQLSIEYAPAPPFDAGTPERAPAAIVQRVREASADARARRAAAVCRSAAALAISGRD